MSTKSLMTLSAFAMGLPGVAFTFLPEEIAVFMGMEPTAILILLLQVLGALYFGFAMLNWMAKANLIGGIYSRPVAIANVAHFLIGALTFLKAASTLSLPMLWLPAILYSLFAFAFIFILYTHPVKSNKPIYG